MHHPKLTWQVAKIHQAEMLKEAAEQRAINSAQANSPKASRLGWRLRLLLHRLGSGWSGCSQWANYYLNITRNPPTCKYKQKIFKEGYFMPINREQLMKKMMVKPTIQRLMPKWLERASQRRAFQAALTRAYATWAPHHWEWVDYSFNEYFLTHRVAPRLIGCLADTTWPDPAELVKMWAEQFTWLDEDMRQRHMAKLIPAVTNFLCCLETELRTHPQFTGDIAEGGNEHLFLENYLKM